MRGPADATPGATPVSRPEGDARRDVVSGAPVPPLLNHLLECREDSRRERSRSHGGVSLSVAADRILEAEAIRARHAGEVDTAEDWFKRAGILSRWDETNVAMHEAQPAAELAYHQGRARQRVLNRLARADMIEDTDD